MINFADLSVADHYRSAQGRVHFINALARVRVAQSAAGAGSSAVLSRQLKAGCKGPSLLPVDLCNKVAYPQKNVTVRS
jgi:hypothetical protein